MFIDEQTHDLNDVVLNNEGLLILDFFATWCIPCRNLAQYLDNPSQTILMAKVDIEKYPALVKRFNVRTVPTLVMLEDDCEVDKITSSNTQQVQQWINKYVKN